MTALLVCLGFAGASLGLGVYIGRLFERHQPTAPVYVLPSTSVGRHPSIHHRPASTRRTVHSSRQAHLRLVIAPFDFEAEEPTPA